MAEWAQELLLTGGVATLALLILVENLFPPIPSEVILPLAGYLVFTGEIDFVAAAGAATVGAASGALALYALGRWGGRPLLLRHHRLLRLSDRRLDQADEWFDRHGAKIVFAGRMVPGVRSVVSVPAGLSEMPVTSFLALTALGSLVWNVALIGAGWLLGDRWEDVTAVVERADLLILAGAAVLAGLVALRLRRTRSS